MDSLDDVARAVRACTDCPLHGGRTNAVPGEGNPSAELMFIGEGPGFHEDRQGRPFVGPAGQLLEGLLASIGTNREEVFIANMVKCRPPENRDPLPGEIASCSKYLERQIELVNPKIIVTLGRFSLGRFFPGESITRARGRLREKDGRQIFPIMHPAAALRRQELRATMVEDFRTLAAALAEAPEPGSAAGIVAVPGAAPGESAGTAEAQASAEAQMDLFGGPAIPAAAPRPVPELEQPDEERGPDINDGNDDDSNDGQAGPQQLSMF